jgi:hypothetical protein
MGWWLLGSFVMNGVLFVAWLIQLGEARDWKKIAKLGFDRIADETPVVPMIRRCLKCGGTHSNRRCPVEIARNRSIN